MADSTRSSASNAKAPKATPTTKPKPTTKATGAFASGVDLPVAVVLLRGVNVGGHKLAMADLRHLCEEAGGRDVRTYIQSGNVVLRIGLAGDDLAADLAERITAHAGYDVPVVVRSADELAATVANCPFDTSVDPTRLVVSFAQTIPDDPLRNLDPGGFGAERFALVGRDLYLWLPDGQGRSKLAQKLVSTPFGKVGTARNWRTVLTLLDWAETPPA